MAFHPFSSSSAASIKKYTDMEVKPGDLIEIFRGGGYQHWAVYVGGGNVVHFGATELGSGSIGSSGGGGVGKVLKQKLEDVVKKDEWRVHNLLDNKYTPRPADDIVKEACSMVDKNLEYNLWKHNCEHFSTEMRYGKPESRQVTDKATGVVSAAKSASAIALIGLAVGGADVGPKAEGYMNR